MGLWQWFLVGYSPAPSNCKTVVNLLGGLAQAMAPSNYQAVVDLLGGLAQAMAPSKYQAVVNLLGGLAQAMAPSKYNAVVNLPGVRGAVPPWWRRADMSNEYCPGAYVKSA